MRVREERNIRQTSPRSHPSAYKLPPESARKPLLHTRGISRARSFDLEVTPWAPTRLTSCIFHPGLEEGSGVSTLEPGPAQLLQTNLLDAGGRLAALTALITSGGSLIGSCWCALIHRKRLVIPFVTLAKSLGG